MVPHTHSWGWIRKVGKYHILDIEVWECIAPSFEIGVELVDDD